MDSWKLPKHVAFQKRSIRLTKFGYDKLSLLFVSQFNSVLGKTCETPQYAYSYELSISFTLNKEEFSSLSVYSPLRSFTDSAKLSARVRKFSEKTVFSISQPNIHNSISSRKSNTDQNRLIDQNCIHIRKNC